MKNDISLYQLTEKEQQDLIKRLTQDVTFLDDDLIIERDELVDSEQDYYNTDLEEVG